MRIILSAFLILTIVSCSKKETSTIPDHNTVTVPENIEPPVIEASFLTAENIAEGKTLVEGADCLTCHQVGEKIIGPSYQEIAAKYSEKDIDLLASKIIEGGSGVWGSVPMAAHPGMSKENAKKMVAYILSNKK